MNSDSTIAANNFIDNANVAFDQLFADWHLWSQQPNPYDQQGPGFWHVGNAMHACVNYFAAVRPDGTRQQNVMKIITDSYNLFNQYPYSPQQGFWYDDYGWFANAFAHALQVPFLLTDQTTPTRSQAMLVAHTVWHNYSTNFCNQSEWCPGCFSQPNAPSGCNTVTNALYLDFSMRLYSLNQDLKYLNSAKQQYTLFKSWIEQSSNGLLTNELNQQVNLVRWGNGSSFVDGSSDWVWSGNQGLLFSGLSALLKHELSIPLGVLVNNLYTGAVENLFDILGILHEAPFDRNLSQDPLDYATGKGVFLRFFSPGIRTENVDIITNTATAAFAARNNNTFRWSDSLSTLNFQNKFLRMWNGPGQVPLTHTMDWTYSPNTRQPGGYTFAIDSDMCILDAQVAAIVALRGGS